MLILRVLWGQLHISLPPVFLTEISSAASKSMAKSVLKKHQVSMLKINQEE